MTGGLMVMVPLGSLQAAILYGADAHEKTFDVTLSEAAHSSVGWDALGTDVLGVFLSVQEISSDELAIPEILILPCIKGERCTEATGEERTSVKGLLSFLRPTHKLSIDGESADALTVAVRSLCVQKKKGDLPRYRIIQDIVSEDETVRSSFVGTCSVEPSTSSEKTLLAAFSLHGALEK